MSDVAGVDPRRLVAAMKAAGFTVYSRKPTHVRMEWPHAGRRPAVGLPSVVVPLDPDGDGFADRISEVLRTLQVVADAGQAARLALEALLRARRRTDPEAARELDAMAADIIAAHNDLHHPGQPCPDDDVTCAEKAREDGGHG